MYIVTFYSFKGGTGRSMALVNVAVALANRGRRVLMVDFDLEAPGLDTFRIGRSRPSANGIVDFIQSYRKTREVPDVRDYVYQIAAEQFKSGGEIWVMPAGKQDEHYNEKFRSIDWEHLYQAEDGFLLFEELKAQWENHIEPDYVLIDSRTGHTDVGGICTRQLPDAVVLFFFPNEQNRRGLMSKVDEIRGEAKGPLKKKIRLLFVMGNVPDLDDEDRILAGNVERMRDTLKYDQLAAVIHHYNSLALLDQVVFTAERPRSRLAHEYTDLTTAIVRGNFEDREAAIDYLDDLIRRVRYRDLQAGGELEQNIATIRTDHSNDGEILRRLATVKRQQRKPEEALVLFNQAIEAGVVDSEILVARADLLISMSNSSAALPDLLRVVQLPDVDPFDFEIAVRSLRQIEANVADAISTSPALDNLRRDIEVIRELEYLPSTLPIATRLMTRWLEEEPDPDTADMYRNELMLCLIGRGLFHDAAKQILANLKPDKQPSMQSTFNLAMANWGISGTPSPSDFSQVVQMHLSSFDHEGANYWQCIALSFWVIGDSERARECAERSRESIELEGAFSAWSYLMTAKHDFNRDIEEIVRLIDGEAIVPRFIRRANEPQQQTIPLQ